MAFGSEYRREHVDFHADFVATAGLLNGAGGAAPPINKSFDLYELFGEARIPIAEDKPFAESEFIQLLELAKKGVTELTRLQRLAIGREAGGKS